MKNLIINAFSYIDKQSDSINLKKYKKDDVIDAYLKCSMVSLITAKYHNSNCDVALVSNIEIPKKFKKLLNKYDIKIFYVDYDKFRFNKEMEWSAAFYKLCAIDYVINNLEYEKYLILDTDTYVIDDLSDLWLEADKKILLFDIQHSLSNKQAQKMNEEYFMLYNENEYLTNYGGEFICGKKDLLKEFMKECEKVYKDMAIKKQITLHGDEFIICSSAVKKNNIIKSANAYIYRYWTGNKFYLVSTNYKYNNVKILHVPNEKDYGFDYIYNYILKKNKIPKNEEVFKIFGFGKSRRPINLKSIYIRIKKRIGLSF